MKNKFSIIVPVYNTEKYLEKCLDSIFKQTYQNYEVIIINDGSTDNSEKIINKYKDKIVYIKKKNEGLSCARNDGIKKANGDYILFLDSDDYLDINLLKNLNDNIKGEDVIRYQLNIVTDNNSVNYYEESFNNLKGNIAFEKICHYKYIELACIYTFKKDYWIENKYEFKKGMYHEDFGLIPKVIYNASSVSSLNIIGYNYYQRDNSIMNDINMDKELKKMNDLLNQGIDILKDSNNYPNSLTNHVANSIFIKLGTFDKERQKEFIEIIKDNKIINYLENKTIKQKIRNLFYKLKYLR